MEHPSSDSSLNNPQDIRFLVVEGSETEEAYSLWGDVGVVYSFVLHVEVTVRCSGLFV